MAVRQLSDGNDDGQVLGQSSTDKIGFYGLETPVVRPALTNYTISPAVPTNISNSFGFTTSDQMIASLALLNALRQTLVTLGLATT
jgi:hypothetical protein